jgi:predicted phage terminase large subunit-like protein
LVTTTDNETRQIAQYKCLNSLLFFTRYFFKAKTKRKFIVGKPHEIITEALERVLKGECKRLIINIAPRYGKTELAVKNFIAHGLALNPSSKFIHLSYSDGLALDNSEEIKDLINEDEYQNLFPKVQVKKDSRAKNKWYTTEGGGVLARSAAGQVTGFGAGKVDDEDEDIEDIEEFIGDIEQEQEEHPILQKRKFAGAIVIDDPIKPEDADSDVIRERVNSRFDSTIRNRVNSRNTPIIVIMQRLHEQDLSGYLIDNEPGEWEVISLPCLTVNAEGQLEALWPFKHTVEELQALKAINELVYDRQYDQNPTSKAGKLFPKSELNFFNPATVNLESIVEFKAGAIDPSDTGGDDLSFPIGYLVGGKVYITDWIYNTDGTDVNEPACVEMIIDKKLNYVSVEGNAAWSLFGKAVRNKVHEIYEDCEIRIIKNTTNKHSRIWAQSATIKNTFIFRSDYQNLPQYEKAMKNLFAYNKSQEGTSKNAHEDAADSLAELAKYYKINHLP